MYDELAMKVIQRARELVYYTQRAGIEHSDGEEAIAHETEGTAELTLSLLETAVDAYEAQLAVGYSRLA